VALKSVSSNTTSLLGIPATAGAAAGSSAANATDASSAAGGSGSTGAGGAATGTAGVGISFVQLLTQSATTTTGTEGSAKTTQSAPQEKSATKDDESGSDSVAMALAMVSQSLAQAASAATQTTAAAGGNVSAAKSDTAQISAALSAAAKVASAAAAAGTVAGAAGDAASGPAGAGASGAGAAATADDADAADGADASAATAQKLFALLMQGADSNLGAQASKDPTQSSDGSQSNSQGNPDNGPTVNASTANAHLSVGSHFSVQHSNEAKSALDIKSPVGSTAWAEELGGKITWMAHQGIESASLKLSPAHLGPVEVRISVQDGGASVWFGAAQADTRAALEQALPRLREMFSTQGLTLADANVSREPPRQQQQPTVHGVASVTGVSEGSVTLSSSSLSSLRIGLLDTYA
jgi:flagellar hook-length control protein FliK